MKKKNNIIKMRKRFDFNIGYFVFIVIVLYLAASVIMYATSKKTTIYEVNTGSITLDNTYTGLIIRDESVIRADYSGTINYYSSDGDKADKVSVLLSIDETGHVSELLDKFEDKNLKDDDLESIKNYFSQYTISYSNNNFDNIYSLKKSVTAKLNHSHYNVILNDLDELIEQSGNTTLFHKIKSIKTGIVMFNIDGYEGIMEDMLSSAYFNDTSTHNINLKETNIINSGDVIYRLIDSDKWNIYIPLNSTEAISYADTNKVSIRFTENGLTCTANFSVIKIGDSNYGKISLDKYMINFADKRYVNFEFSEATKSGLKIPISSVFEKSFYTIPLKYITDSNNFVRVTYNRNGEKNLEPVEATIYDSDDKYYYVSMDDFSSGDIIICADTDDQYVIGTIGELDGVYCVNKGYAIFKKIDIIDKNNEYYIVRQGTTYGLKVYDHIVLNCKTVNENELVN